MKFLLLLPLVGCITVPLPSENNLPSRRHGLISFCDATRHKNHKRCRGNKSWFVRGTYNGFRGNSGKKKITTDLRSLVGAGENSYYRVAVHQSFTTLTFYNLETFKPFKVGGRILINMKYRNKSADLAGYCDQKEETYTVSLSGKDHNRFVAMLRTGASFKVEVYSEQELLFLKLKTKGFNRLYKKTWRKRPDSYNRTVIWRGGFI